MSSMSLATTRVISLGLGITGSIVLYNTLVISVGAWLASLVAAFHALFALEDKLKQKLLKAP